MTRKLFKNQIIWTSTFKHNYNNCYLVGGGTGANVPKGEIKRITKIEFDEDLSLFDDDELQMVGTVKNSIAVENEIPISGGRGEETIEEIRENALAHFGSQNRAVTRKDYQVRALTLLKYGGVAKAYMLHQMEN